MSIISLDRIMVALEEAEGSLSNPGFCTACGDEVEDVEPDAREVECEVCGEFKVYGADELLLMMT